MTSSLRRAFGLALLLASAGAAAQGAATILLNGRIASLDARNTVHEALALRDGRIVAAGRNADIRKLAGRDTKVVDLGGRTVIPGLIDSHMHAIRAASSYATEVHWFGATSLDEALGRLRAAAQKARPGEWLVVAGGWTEEQFRERRRPTQAELLAAAPDHPVYVQWMYGWVMLTPAGHKALGLASESDLPGGGKFERGPDGNPTGAIVGGIVPLFDKLPRPTFAQKVEGTKRFFRELNRVGLTGVGDPGGFNMSPEEYAPLFDVWRRGDLTVRVRYSYFAQKRGRELEEFKELTQLLPMGMGDAMLRFNGVGERVTFGMYNNEKPSEAEREQFFQAALWAARQGMTLTQHWHGDATVGTLLDVFERVNREVPIAPLRWSIAHLNDASEATLVRMKTLGVGWTMQDAMVYDGERELKARGPEALSRMPPLVTAARVGTRVGAGTDAHRVANYNPFVALRWMLDGKSVGGVALRGAAESPDRVAALRLYTQGSAWFSHEDQVRGTLEAGKLADLAVLDRDYFSVPVAEIANLQSMLTMVGGRVVYGAGPFKRFE